MTLNVLINHGDSDSIRVNKNEYLKLLKIVRIFDSSKKTCSIYDP